MLPIKPKKRLILVSKILPTQKDTYSCYREEMNNSKLEEKKLNINNKKIFF